MSRRVRQIKVRTELSNDFAAMQFLQTVMNLIVRGKKCDNSVRVSAVYKLNKQGRVAKVRLEYTFKSWRNLEEIRLKLQRHNPTYLEVFCPYEKFQKEASAK